MRIPSFRMRNVKKVTGKLPQRARQLIWPQPYDTYSLKDYITLPDLYVGRSGAGKTRAMEVKYLAWCLKLKRAGAWIDVMGDAFDALKTEIAIEARRDRSLYERVILIDALDEDSTVGFNPLDPWPGYTQEQNAGHVVEMMKHILGLGEETPRLNWVLTNTIAALADLGMKFTDADRWWFDRKFRESLIDDLSYWKT